MSDAVAWPTPGSPAPDFALSDQDGAAVRLADLAGRWVVLYFYPRDNTSGCTTEALQFSGLADDFAACGATVVGVSPDSVRSHAGFIAKQGLKLRLLADPEHALLTACGAWRLKTLYGKQSEGVVRSTLLIDPAGRVAKVWPKVKADGHAAQVLETLRGLAGR